MSRGFLRRLGTTAAVLAVVLAFPAASSAAISGGCEGEGHSSSGSGANLTTDTEWHLKSDDVAGGTGTSVAKMHAASVAAYALGIGIPIASGTSDDGETVGSVEGISLETYAILGHRFVVSGSASGDALCSGQIEILLDDVNPLFTVLGGGGIILALIGLVALLLFSRSSGGCLNRLLSAMFGGLGGLGAALALEQFEVLDPTQPIGLFIVVGLALLGFVSAGLFGPKDVPPATTGTTYATTPVGSTATTGALLSDPLGGWAPVDPPGPASVGTDTDVYPGGGVGGGSGN